MHVLIIDDDFGCRVGMAHTLQDFYPSCRVSQAESVEAAIGILSSAVLQVELVLLDLYLKQSRGIETLRLLKGWCEENDCNPRIVVVSAGAEHDDTLIPEAIESCATGFISKGTSVEIFRSAVALTLAGGLYIPERYLQARRRVAPAIADESPTFTPREKQVAALLVHGLTYKQIARRLAGPDRPMSDHTVRVHVQRMAWKLRLGNEAAAEGLAAKAAVLTAFAEQRLKFALE